MRSRAASEAGEERWYSARGPGAGGGGDDEGDKENVDGNVGAAGSRGPKRPRGASADGPHAKGRRLRLLAILRRVERLGCMLAEYTRRSRARASLRACSSGRAMSACLGLGIDAFLADVDAAPGAAAGEGAEARSPAQHGCAAPESVVGVFSVGLRHGRMEWRWPIDLRGFGIRIL